MNDLFSFVSLQYMLQNKNFGRAFIKRLLSEYVCDKDIDVQHFLNNLALEYEKNGRTKTYFIMDKKQTKILLFFSIKQKSVSLMTLNKDSRAILVGDSRESTATGILIAQLGKNWKHYNDHAFKKISPMIIWDFIYEVIDAISKASFAPQLLIIDCKKELIHYYEKQGFFRLSNDNLNNLVTMYKKYVL